MIISNGDTLFSARLVEGHEIPKFNKKVFGFYIEINKKKVIRKSFVYKGRLTGYYVRYNGKEIVEQGYFYKGLRRILD